MRPTKDETFITIANHLALLSTCSRSQVGALIVMDGRCISWGYNGAPPGMPHCDANNHGWGSLVVDLDEVGCRNATHAEANALAAAARQGISTDFGTMYVSLSPCITCARLIIAAGIKRVVWDVEYRDTSGIRLLSLAYGEDEEVELSPTDSQ